MRKMKAALIKARDFIKGQHGRVHAPNFVAFGPYQRAWNNTRQPGPGADRFAYDTLDLYRETPVGHGVGQLAYIRPLEGQVYTRQAVPIVGIPTTSGQIFGQPLLDPAAINSPTVP